MAKKSDEDTVEVENPKPSLAEIHAARARRDIATHWLSQRMPTNIEKPTSVETSQKLK